MEKSPLADQVVGQPSENQKDMRKYMELMAELKMRMKALERDANRVNKVFAGVVQKKAERKRIFLNHEVLLIERSALQLRKILELVAFASLAANRQRFAAAKPNFSEYWRAKKLIADLRKQNEFFWPQPMTQRFKDGHHEFTAREAEDYLTEAEFPAIFDAVSDILHIHNPYTLAEINLGRTIVDWMQRIRNLLKVHVVDLSEGSTLLVDMRDWHQAPLNVALAQMNADSGVVSEIPT